MLDQDVGFLAFETQGGGGEAAQFATVDIATHCTQRTYGVQPLGQFYGANVSGMPYLVARGKVFFVAGVPIAVGVGQ